MPFDTLEPLPDACLSDPSAPCFYWHLKLAALNGHRDRLSAEQLEFVGVVSRRRDTSGGWHQPNEIGLLASVDEQDADPELTPILQALVNRDRLEFLG